MSQLTHGSLFAGIGGFDLGFERAGIKTIWQVEIDEYCRRVLERHFPGSRRFSDVRAVHGAADCYNGHTGPCPDCLVHVDIITGGFPCQDVSAAGKRVGLSGPRSVLWREMRRVLCELRPRYAVIENTPGLFERGFGDVLRDLAEIGFDAEWTVLSACQFGAPHTRERVFILAYPNGATESGERRRERSEENGAKERHIYWKTLEPTCLRMAHGVPNRMDRLRGAGNAVVPQIAEWIGRRLVEADRLR